MKISVAKGWKKLRSVPIIGLVLGLLISLMFKLKSSSAFVAVSKKFVTGTLATKIGISTVSVAMVGATGVGSYLAVQQFVGSAGSQFVITSPTSGTTMHTDFEIRTEFRAASDITSPINIVVSMDGRVVMSKIINANSTFKNGGVYPYIFSGGVNGVNMFPMHNLKPGQHTINATAKLGGVIGQGSNISSTTIPFYAQPKNFVAAGEAKEVAVSSFTLDPPARAFLSPDQGIFEKLADSANKSGTDIASTVSSTVRGASNNLGNLITPKAEAHTCNGCRHGDLDVFAEDKQGKRISGVPISISHPSLSACDSGNSGVTNGLGAVNFRGCPVSNIGGNDATYTVTAGDTPPGYTIAGTHSRTVTLLWNQNVNARFIYDESKAPAPAPPPAGPPGSPTPSSNSLGNVLYAGNDIVMNNGDSLTSSNGRFKFIFQGDSNMCIYDRGHGLWCNYTHGDGSTYLHMQGDGNLVKYRSNGTGTWASNTNGTGADRLVMRDDGNLVITTPGGQVVWDSFSQGGTPGPDPGLPAPPPPSPTVINYNHAPGDGPLIAVTGLSATGAEVDVFGYQTQNNFPLDFVRDVTVTIDGTQRGIRSDFSKHPSHRGTSLDFGGVNIADGNRHTLVFKATNDNNLSNSATIVIPASGSANPSPLPPPPPPTGGSPPASPTTPSLNVGKIKVGVYAHDKAGQVINTSIDNRVGNVYISTENIGVGPTKQCYGTKHTLSDGKTKSTTAGLTNADRASGPNGFGLIRFTECPVAEQTNDNHAKKYRVTMNVPAGFTLDSAYNNGVGAVVNGNIVYRDVTLRKNLETEVSFLLIGSNGSVENPNNPSPGPVPNPPGSNAPPPANPTTPAVAQLCDTNKNTAGVANPTNGKGAIVVCTYDTTGGKKTLMGEVEVHTKSIGAADTPQFQCDPRNRTSGSDGSNGIKGRVSFVNCPVAQDGGAKTYQLSLVKRAGYREADNSPHKAGCDNSKYHFKVNQNKVTRIEIYLVQGAGSITCDPVPVSSTPGGGTNNTSPVPSSNKAGRVTVETWVDTDNKGTFKDQPFKNISIEMVSTGRPNDNCTPSRGNTKAETATGPASIGFSSCPVAFASNNDYAKQWEINATIPSGYTMSKRFSANPDADTKIFTENGVQKIKRTVTLQKDEPATFSIIFLNNATGGGCPVPTTGGVAPGQADCGPPTTPVPSTGAGAAHIPVVCDDIKTTISPLSRAQTKMYADYACTAGARMGVDPALILAIISVESMDGSLVKDPIAFKAKVNNNCGGASPVCKGPGQMKEGTWNSNKFGGRLLYPGDGGTGTNAVDTFPSTWDDQKWSDAVFTVANYIDKTSNPSERLSEEQVRKAACGYNSGNKSACRRDPGFTSGYNAKVLAAWKKFRNSASNGDAGNLPANPGTTPLPDSPGAGTNLPSRVVGGVKWSWPVSADYPLSSCWRDDRGDHLHSGIDVGAAGKSAPGIRAAAVGTVVAKASNTAPFEGYGNAVYIKHPVAGNPTRFYYTLYAHLASFQPGIEVGKIVVRGQLVGRMGNTGGDYAVHLHFNIQNSRSDTPSGNAQDPPEGPGPKGLNQGTLNPLNYLPNDGRGNPNNCKAGSVGY